MVIRAVKMRKIIYLLLVLMSSTLWASGSGHSDPVVPVLLGLIVLFVGAQLGAFAAIKLSQPVVLGELIFGIIFGNLALLGFSGFDFIASGEIFSIMASIGVILLLFEVGLESSLNDMLKVGVVAFLVACIGIVVPFILGFGTSYFFMPLKSSYVHAFVGAALCATSVGITARVLKDMGKINLKESKIILGAAVIDDVLGLLILAVVSGIIVSAESGGEGIGASSIARIIFEAVAFIIGSLLIGARVAPGFFKFGSKLKGEGVLISLSLCFCFFLSYLANLVGLAPIVGAFAAGLIVDGKGYAKFFKDSRSIEHLLFPISKFFVPIFFVHMGMQVNLKTLFDPSIILFGLVLSLAAILGKQLCGLGAIGKKSKNLSRLLIGVGMVPRGEVGLIFAAIGRSLTINGSPVIDDSLYSVIVIMVMITTLITPMGLKWAIDKKVSV
jgi:Kef-type K+ transport system membrane component KefB